MARTAEEDRGYLMRRSDDHLQLADRCDDATRRALHQRFAALYRERADALAMVEPD